jgi:hypothetical protein
MLALAGLSRIPPTSDLGLGTLNSFRPMPSLSAIAFQRRRKPAASVFQGFRFPAFRISALDFPAQSPEPKAHLAAMSKIIPHGINPPARSLHPFPCRRPTRPVSHSNITMSTDSFCPCLRPAILAFAFAFGLLPRAQLVRHSPAAGRRRKPKAQSLPFPFIPHNS